MSKRILTSQIQRKIGNRVKVAGWVATRRDHGKIMFFDLRDREGLVQIVFSPEAPAEALAKAGAVRPEWVVEIEGKVQKRPENLRNPNIATGDIEIAADKLTILSEARPLPLPIDTDGYEIGEDTRLKYRYLDLRRPRLQHNLAIRSQYVQAARQYLFSQGFLEI